MDIDTHDLETKAGIPPEALVTHGEMMRIVEDFKQANDERLTSIEKRRGDVLLEEKVARMNEAISTHQRQIDTLTVKQARPPLASERADAQTHDAREHKSAFDIYVRSGESAGLRALELKAMSVGSNPDGGYVVPPELERAIGERLLTISPIRSLAARREISSNLYKKPFMTAGPAVGWVGETDPRAQTTSPTLAELSFPAMELYAQPAATAMLLDDAAVNIAEWLASEIDQVFAQQEGIAFVTGDGINKPKGFLAYTTVANASWSWGSIGYVASGAAGAFPASNPADVLIDLTSALGTGYRQNGTFAMNRKTQSAIRKFKDSNGNYLWSPGLQAGQPATLLGYPLAVDDNMPDIAANSLSVAFGEFSRRYQ